MIHPVGIEGHGTVALAEIVVEGMHEVWSKQSG